MSTELLTALLLVLGAIALVLRWLRPAWYWMTFGIAFAMVRVTVRYASVMDACGLTVPPSRLRMTLARMANRPAPESRPPRVLRMRPTRTGLVLRLKLRPGQDAFDFAASTDRLRHSFSMQGIVSREIKSGVVELRMTGYDVLKRVQMPAKIQREGLRIPVALREDGEVHFRDYQEVPHALNLGATKSGKSMYQRCLIKALAPLDVALVGIDCKRGVEQTAFSPRLSALAITPDQADALLDALVEEMEERFDLLCLHQGIAPGTPLEDITSDIWGLPKKLRPVPIVVLIDEIAELFLITSRADTARRDRMVTQLVRLAQLARAVGIYLEVCGQRFGSELGKGATALRAQLTGRVVHRCNDKQTADMGLGDVSELAVFAATSIAPEQAGTAIAGDSSGGWSRIRTPKTSLGQVAAVCHKFGHLTPQIPALAPFRPRTEAPVPVTVPMGAPSTS